MMFVRIGTLVLVGHVPSPDPGAIASFVKLDPRPQIQQGKGVDLKDVERAHARIGFAVVGNRCAYEPVHAGGNRERIVYLRERLPLRREGEWRAGVVAEVCSAI